MASFTSVGDTTTATLVAKGDDCAVALSGTYNMTIALQREQGSPGSGSWEVLNTWSTANATVAYVHTATLDNERLRLIVQVDTSGTCTATLTVTSNQATTVSNYTEATLAVTDIYAGRVITGNRAAGIVFTLPAATGTGDEYEFYCGTTITSGAFKVAALGTDTMSGAAIIATDIAGVVMITGATTDYISMNGSTTGGLVGSWVRVRDVASAKWSVFAICVSTGAEADPFGAT